MSSSIKYSLSLKFTVFISLMGLLIGGLIIFIGYHMYYQHIFESYAKRGEALITTTAKNINWDKIEYYSETLSADDEYEETLEEMRIFARSGGVSYLYVLAPAEDGCIYIYDTDTSDRHIPLGGKASWAEAVGEELDENELRRGIRIEPTISNTDYGWLISIYVPFTDSHGNFVAYIGVDYPAAEFLQEQQSFIFQLVLVSLLATVIITALFMLIFQRLVLKPTNKIVHAAQDYLLDEDSDLTVETSISSLDIHSRDELQSLTESLQTMEQRMKDYLTGLDDANQKASIDPMTGLLNRESFRQRVETLLLSEEGINSHAFMMIDIDNFKSINDTWGHVIGDEAILVCAKTLQSKFRSQDFVARIGGDEFAVFYRNTPSLEEVKRRSQEIVEAIREAYIISDVKLTTSIGVAYIENQHNTSYQQLYEVADEALYEVKDAGRNGYIIKQG